MTPFGIRKKLKALLFGDSQTPIPPRPEISRYAVTFELPDGTSYQADAKHEDSLVMTSGRGPMPINTGCADGTCATCQVDVLEGAEMLSPADEHEEKCKTENKVPAERRLGCQTAVLGDGVKVRIINVFGEEPVDA
jgi:2Fe-2S ferredoxin